MFILWTDVSLHPDALALVAGQAELVGPGVQAGDGWVSLAKADVALVGSGFQGTAATFDRAPRLRLVGRFGIGYDNIDVDAATARGILVTHTPDAPTESTAEFAITLMLALARCLPHGTSHLAAGQWPSPAQVTGMDLAGKTLGLVGLGRIGGRVAEIARVLRMAIIAYDPYVTLGRVDGLGVRLAPDLATLLAAADLVSLHAPLTAETYALINARALAQMQPGALLINVARGPLVVEADLITALQAGHVAGAALDVWDPEPPAPDNPLLHLDNVIATPHMAAMTREGRYRSHTTAVRQALMVLAGEQPPGLLNPDIWRTAQRIASCS